MNIRRYGGMLAVPAKMCKNQIQKYQRSANLGTTHTHTRVFWIPQSNPFSFRGQIKSHSFNSVIRAKRKKLFQRPENNYQLHQGRKEFRWALEKVAYENPTTSTAWTWSSFAFRTGELKAQMLMTEAPILAQIPIHSVSLHFSTLAQSG